MQDTVKGSNDMYTKCYRFISTHYTCASAKSSEYHKNQSTFAPGVVESYDYE